jgi:hypothetical protein
VPLGKRNPLPKRWGFRKGKWSEDDWRWGTKTPQSRNDLTWDLEEGEQVEIDSLSEDPSISKIVPAVSGAIFVFRDFGDRLLN